MIDFITGNIKFKKSDCLTKIIDGSIIINSYYQLW